MQIGKNESPITINFKTQLARVKRLINSRTVSLTVCIESTRINQYFADR